MCWELSKSQFPYFSGYVYRLWIYGFWEVISKADGVGKSAKYFYHHTSMDISLQSLSLPLLINGFVHIIG